MSLRNSIFYGMVLFGLWFVPEYASSEPWLGNRYAQNCAGCHAPGRKNLPAAKRRCTLACQGCHVSPQGSGMRSQYGKWTEDRWLRSFRSDLIGNEKSFAPYPKQLYASISGVTPEDMENENEEEGNNKQKKKRAKPDPSGNNKAKGLFVKRGALLKTIPGVEMKEELYDRRDRLEFVTAKSRAEFDAQIPMEDPYRDLDRTKMDGGADIRWQFQTSDYKISTPAGDDDGKMWHNFLMSADLYLRWRPIHKKVHLVYEGRQLGSPSSKKLPENPGATMSKRSLYLLVDDLPYATYFQAGYYRPIFASPSADHTLLPQRMISWALQGSPIAYNLHYQAYSVGGSPNVPFANLSLMTRQFGVQKNETTKGIAFNGGGRFVSFGASVTYSYWRQTQNEIVNGQTVETALEMNAIGLAGMLGPVTATFDAIAFNKDVPQSGFFSGGVYSLETYTRFWRENYFVFGYHMANVAENLLPGRGSQLRLGVRSFLLPGLEVQLGMRRENQETDGVDDRTADTGATLNAYTGQIHLFL